MTNVLKAPEPTQAATGSPWLRFYRSPIGKKLITGITGLALATFTLVHMLGNLTMFLGRNAYNSYGDHLADFGVLLYAVEGILLIGVLLHGAVGIEIFAHRLKARQAGYQQYQSVGEGSYQTASSRTMIITGTLLAGFLVAHLLTFKFGPYYTTELGHENIRDLAQLVIEVFHKPPYVIGYSIVMVLLGLHLRHGIWSVFQSFGTLDKAWRPLVFGASTVLAVAIALGFIVLPWTIYFDVVG
jgi:succinate dehydrogenase / fumarate reductase, cytochrome b subunit